MGMVPMNSRQLSGSYKAAILIRSMGERAAAGLLSRLTTEEREVVNRQPQPDRDPVAPAGRSGCPGIHSHGAAVQIRRPRAAKPVRPRRVGRQKDRRARCPEVARSEDIFELIKDEHPQTMAIVLIHLKTGVASDVLSRMADELKTDVALRIVSMEKIVASMVDEVNAVFKDIMKNKKTAVASMSGGLERLAEILNQTDEISSELILNEIEEANAELAAQIKQKMFVFEDLVLVDDRGFQKLLRRVETKELSVALKAASDEVKQKVLKNMSERAAEMLREEIETLGPVRMKEVSDAQQAITAIIQEMETKGEVIISGRRGEQIVA